MKFGCNYSFWQNSWAFSHEQYLEMTKRLSNIGFDVLEISADHLYHMTDEEIDALKEQGKFDVEAQKIAFEKAKAAALASMDTAAREFLTTALGDFDAWLDTIIEKLVKDNKTPTAVLRNK